MRAQLLILVDLLDQNKRCVSIRKHILAALGLSFFLPTFASAACYTDGASGRLSNFCALDRIEGKKTA